MMLWLLFGRSLLRIDGMTYGENLLANLQPYPFYTILRFVKTVLHSSNVTLVRHCFINLAGNILLFVPAGIFLPVLWKPQQKFFIFFLTCAGIIAAVEMLQLITMLGVFDVDDIILNLLGMGLGFGIWKFSCFLKESL